MLQPHVYAGPMIRFPFVLLCSILISGAAFAFPKPVTAGGQSLVVRVQEQPEGPPWHTGEPGSPADCRRFAPENSPAECAGYWRWVAARLKEKQAAAIAKAKAARTQGPSTAQIAKQTASRALSERERSAQAARPLLPPEKVFSVKAVPGKTPEERLRHLAGQLVLTGFAGRQPGEAGVERVSGELRDGKISGVIVRDSNVASVQQLRQLLAAFAKAGGENPALIAIDQPGGPDTVLSEDKGFSFYNSANAVSSAASPYEAQLLYRTMAGELSALGVTLNIGPSEDVCREDGVNLSALCFGTAPSGIAAYARAFNFGHHDRGVLTALRHEPFQPGLRTSWSSERPGTAMMHLLVSGETSDAMVVRIKAMEPLRLTHFALALHHGKAKAQNDRSFGFPRALIFEIEMPPGGAPVRYSEAILRAFQAGADMILLREPSGIAVNIPAVTLEALQAGLKSGRLQLARIEDAYWHVQRLKARLRAFPLRTKIAGLDRDPPPSYPGGVE